MKLKEFAMNIPVFRSLSHWLLRVPLIIVFIQQGLSKMPVTQETADVFGLPLVVWWFVAFGELGAGLGLLVGGLIMFTSLAWIGDLITRFSGFVIGCIVTGVIWISQPESLAYVLLYDHFHVLLWVGGLFFALRGSRT